MEQEKIPFTQLRKWFFFGHLVPDDLREVLDHFPVAPGHADALQDLYRRPRGGPQEMEVEEDLHSQGNQNGLQGCLQRCVWFEVAPAQLVRLVEEGPAVGYPRDVARLDIQNRYPIL